MIIRDTFTSARTYYVRTDGSDSNNGLSNTAAGAFLTIQKAVDTVCDTIDNMGYAVTIQVADGAYNAPVTLRPYVGRGTVTLQGNTTTPSNVTITTSSGHAINAVCGDQSWSLKGFKISTTGANSYGILITSSKLSFANIDFGSCASGHIASEKAANVAASGSYTISGGAPFHIISYNSIIDIRNRSVTLTGTPAFSSVFAAATLAGVLWADGATFTGTATGARYNSIQNSIIHTNGGGSNFFPGNIAGTTQTGGLYV